MGDTIGEGDLRDRLAQGGRIEAVVVIARRDEAGGLDHIPYLLPSWRRGYVAIALFRGPGVRGWRDLDRLLQFLRKDMAYPLPVTLYEEDCPRLARLRSVLPRGAITKHIKADTSALPPGLDVPEPQPE